METKKILNQTMVKEQNTAGVLTCPSCKGLRMEVTIAESTGKPRKIWTYRYRARTGALRQIKLGEFPSMTVDAAKAAYRIQKVIRDDPAHGDPRSVLEAKTREDRKAKDEAKAQAYSVGRLCADYISEHLEKRRKNPREPKRLLETDVIPQLGKISANELGRSHVHGRIQAIINRGAPRIAQMVRTELRTAYEHAVSAGRLSDNHPNPCDRVKAPPQKKRKRALSDQELELFFKWLPTARMSRTVKDVLMIELLTTARQGEIVSMKWSDCDIERAVWTQPTSKNGHRHEVMLSTQAIEIIKARKGLHDTYVFPLPKECGGNKHVGSKTVGIQQWAGKATLKIADWTPHDLRRSAVTGLARLGCDKDIRDRISNHVNCTVDGNYNMHQYDGEAKDWLQRWGAKIDELRRIAKNEGKESVRRIPRVRPAMKVVHVSVGLSQ